MAFMDEHFRIFKPDWRQVIQLNVDLPDDYDRAQDKANFREGYWFPVEGGQIALGTASADAKFEKSIITGTDGATDSTGLILTSAGSDFGDNLVQGGDRVVVGSESAYVEEVTSDTTLALQTALTASQTGQTFTVYRAIKRMGVVWTPTGRGDVWQTEIVSVAVGHFFCSTNRVKSGVTFTEGDELRIVTDADGRGILDQAVRGDLVHAICYKPLEDGVLEAECLSAPYIKL